MDNGQLDLKEIEIFYPQIKPEAIETLSEVAKGLGRTPGTLKKIAMESPQWRGRMMRICKKRGEGKAGPEEYFFPVGTIEANKEKFVTKTKSINQEIEALKAENEHLKKLTLRLESIEMRIKNGGLLPAEGEEGPGF